MIKQYYARVSVDMTYYFMRKLKELNDMIYKVEASEVKYSESEGLHYREYIITAEEGIIDPEYEMREL